MFTARVLLLCAVDALIAADLLDITTTKELEDTVSVTFVFPDGTPGIAHARSIGYGEVTVVALYGPGLDVTQTNWAACTSGQPSSIRKLLKADAYALGWLERKTGKYLMGNQGESDVLSSISDCARRSVTSFTDEVVKRTRDYGSTGRFIV